MQKRMTNDERMQWIEKAFDDPKVIQSAISKGIADAKKKYIAAGYPMATWRAGRVVWVNPVTGAEVPKPSRKLDDV